MLLIMNDDAKNLARNLQKLMEYYDITQRELASKAGVSQKTVSNMLNPGDDKAPMLSNVEHIAVAFNLKTWHLLIPNCPLDLLINTTVEKLVENYLFNDEKGRNAVMSVSEIRAQYLEEPKTLKRI